MLHLDPVLLLVLQRKRKILVSFQMCFNMRRHNAEEIRTHNKYVDERLLKIEARQKEIIAKSEIPHSAS